MRFLLDELHVRARPIALGDGWRLFDGGSGLPLLDCTQTSAGVPARRYGCPGR